MFKILNGLAHRYFSEMFTCSASFRHDNGLRSSETEALSFPQIAQTIKKIVLHLLEPSGGTNLPTIKK